MSRKKRAATLDRPDDPRRSGPHDESAPAHDARTSRIPAPPGTIHVVGPLPRIHNRAAILFWSAVSLALLCFTVPGHCWWPCGYVCLVPWLICATCGAKARFVYFTSYLVGFGFFLINVRWMFPVTIPGYLALAAFFAFQFPLAAWPIRHLYQKRGFSIALITPIAWTAIEFLRSIGPLGFPMLLLGHSQYRVLTIIQISDLVGAYGVSFVLAMVNGLIADLMVQPILLHRAERTARLPAGAPVALIILVGAVIYGVSQSSTRHLTKGPVVAMIQHDIPMYTVENTRPNERTMFEAYLDLTRSALTTSAEQPDRVDLVVLPETAVVERINEEFLNAGPDELEEIRQRVYSPDWTLNDLRSRQRDGKQMRNILQKLCDESLASMVVGATGIIWKPTAIPARADRYNSAYLLVPNKTTPAARYDKRHLVLFGEYVPFRFTIPWLYDWLNSITPWGRGGRHYSLSMGEGYSAFEFPAAGDTQRKYRVGTPICYEEIMPYIAREFARDGEKNIDLLTPISNDGWFMHTAELEQHLAAGVFRAVENRVAVARAVNTGASAMIYPNGKIHSRVQLADESMRRLPALESALLKLPPVIEAMRKAGGSSKEYDAAVSRLGGLYESDLIPAYRALGPVFWPYAERLIRLRGYLRSARDTRAEVIDHFEFHVSEEISAVKRWQKHPETAPGFAVDQAMLDGRLTLYTRWGDWFAQALLVLTGVAVMDWMQLRFRRRRRAAQTKEGEST